MALNFVISSANILFDIGAIINRNTHVSAINYSHIAIEARI